MVLQGTHRLDVGTRQARRPGRRRREMLDPAGDIVAPKASESLDVAVPGAGEDHADWWQKAWCDAAAPKHHVHQRASRPAIAVVELMVGHSSGYKVNGTNNQV